MATGCRRSERSWGQRVPIVATGDPHANLSPRMTDSVDAIIAYRTNPHVDQLERGLEAAHLLVERLHGTIRPHLAAVFPPLGISIDKQCTDEAPLAPLMERIEAVRQRPEILTASLWLGFPYADVPEMGAAVTVVADGDAGGGATRGRRDRAGAVGDAGGAAGGPAQGPGRGRARAGVATAGLPARRRRQRGRRLRRGRHRAGRRAAAARRPEGVRVHLRSRVGRRGRGRGHRRHPELPHRRQDRPPARRHAGAGVPHPRPVRRPLLRAGGAPRRPCSTTTRAAPRWSRATAGSPSCSPRSGGAGQHPSAHRLRHRSGQLRGCIVAKGVNAPLAAYREVCPSFIRVDTPGSTAPPWASTSATGDAPCIPSSPTCMVPVAAAPLVDYETNDS